MIVIFISGCSSPNKPGIDNNTSLTTTEENHVAMVQELTSRDVWEMDYDKLSENEKEQYDDIRKSIENNSQYTIQLSAKESNTRQIIYDFDNDGKIEILEYSTIVDKNEYGSLSVKECTIKFGDTFVNRKYTSNNEVGGGINKIGIFDANKGDDYIDFYISEGFLSDRVVNNLYRLTGKKIEKICELEGEILSYSRDGKIYYWGGNLYETKSNIPFDEDLALIFYDIDRKQFIKNDGILGNIITAGRRIIIFKNKEDVISGAPVSEDEILKNNKDKILRILNPGESFSIISIDGAISSIDTGEGILLKK